MLQSPRKKEITHEESEFTELRHRSLSFTRFRHILTDSLFSYVWWYEEIVDYVMNAPYQNMAMIQLPPLQQDEEYLRDLASCIDQCSINVQANAYLNSMLQASVDSLMNQFTQFPLFCENFESIKSHFASMMDPFRLLVFERSLTFNRYNLLYFYKDLDAMAKVYFHTFRKAPSSDLLVQWMMSSLSNDIFSNGALLNEIHSNWALLHNDPQGIRRIMNHHLQHKKR